MPTLKSALTWIFILPVLGWWCLSWALHRFMMFLDAVHRRRCKHHQSNWPYETVPHVRHRLRDASSPVERAGWRLDCHEGRQRWFYDASRTVADMTFIEKYNLGLTDDGENNVSSNHAAREQRRRTADAALLDGIKFLCQLQDDRDGHWPNDYSGPLFLTCGPVFAKYVMFKGDIEQCWTAQERSELIRYLVNAQLDDGGFGMHTEGGATMFGTVLNYVVLRMLGAPKTHHTVKSAQQWIKNNGGAQSIPSWGKAWLCVLGLYEWTGMNAVSAELWLLPDWFPISMSKVWCHSRVVTLCFSWLYSTRWRCEETPLLADIRNELYSVIPYDKIDWPSCRNNVSGPDLYFPVSGFYHIVNKVLLLYEHTFGPIKFLRKQALQVCYDHMRFDDTSTNYICLGPVNKALNMLIAWIVEGGESERVQRHLDRIPDYFWMGYDGMRMSGYNGSQLWDTSFALQAIFAAGPDVIEQFKNQVAAGHHYIDIAQVRDDPEGYRRYYRSRAKGAWNFSTRAQAWQVSDCTAEGLRVALLARVNASVLPLITPLEDQRLFDAVDTILALRYTEGDGAWASYEEPRAPTYYELLNCAEVYKDIMIDYTYAECTSSCVHTLVLFREQFPQYRSTNVAAAIADGVREIKRKQRRDGSWYGSWAVCFTYAAWLSTEALRLAGESPDAPVMRAACEFLLSKQRDDGGWGEDFNACVTMEWVENADGSQVVNTAWAVMALIAAGGRRHLEAVERGINLIMSRQLASGNWRQERISGVFNGNCAIHYPSYKNNMTVWALAKYRELKEQEGV